MRFSGTGRRKQKERHPMLLDYLHAHNEWSARTFGTDQRTTSIITHIRNEIVEVRNTPHDLIEYIDIVILAFDGAFVTNHQPTHVVHALQGPLSLRHPWHPLSDILRDMERELVVLERFPFFITRWANIITLAFQGAFQQDYTTEQVIFALRHKQSINFGRKWQIPEDEDAPIEHIRTEP
jgi:hypothetical protein